MIKARQEVRLALGLDWLYPYYPAVEICKEKPGKVAGEHIRVRSIRYRDTLLGPRSSSSTLAAPINGKSASAVIYHK